MTWRRKEMERNYIFQAIKSLSREIHRHWKQEKARGQERFGPNTKLGIHKLSKSLNL